MNNNLRKIRKMRGMTQQTLANLTGLLFQEQISLLETGKRPPTEVEKAALAAVLGVSAEKIFPESEPDGVQRAYR